MEVMLVRYIVRIDQSYARNIHIKKLWIVHTKTKQKGDFCPKGEHNSD